MKQVLFLSAILPVAVLGQDIVGVLEGLIRDRASETVSGADVTVKSRQTGLTLTEQSAHDGSFHFSNIPVGEYSLKVTAKGFAVFSIDSIRIDVDRDVRIPVKLTIASAHSEVIVVGTAALDMGSGVGNVVSSREATDLPLNGRNFTQLGLLQPGVAPMTSGLLQAGGIVRSQQAYGVNGQAPESNNYLLDGMTNVDSVNGAFAIRTPVDAISEFRALTLNAPAEYGQTAGATTTVVTKSGSNNFHGDLYEFVRNDAFDARNFFGATTEPLHQNQFGATLGGPIRKNKDFFFAYYEGFRNVQGETQAAIVPTAAQRTGDFSGLVDPGTGQQVPLINEFTGQQFPNNQIPSFLLNPIALKAEGLIPLPNIGTNVFSATQSLTQEYNQGGARYDHYFDSGDRLFGRYAGSALNTLDPLPINGSGVPGFPVANGITTYSATVSEVHAFSPTTVQTVQLSFFRNAFIDGQATNHTPGRSLGFQYQPSLAANSGTPYMIISGYTDIGDPITGPQNTSQNDYQGSYSLSTTRGRHSLTFGGALDRQQINLLLGIATNGFFVFAPFPISDSFASYLVGERVQFFQGGGDFNRGLRKWIGSIYAQDEWRVHGRK